MGEKTPGGGISTGRRVFVLGAFAVFVVVAFAASVTLGSVRVPLEEIWQSIFGVGAGTHQQIIMNIRLPRTIVAALVGVNLALSGAILQAVMKNPLADPHIIGISSGAGIAGITMMLVYPGHEYLITPVAFVGAMSAAIVIYLLAWKNGIRPVRIILAGVAVSAFLGAGISAMMTITRAKMPNPRARTNSSVTRTFQKECLRLGAAVPFLSGRGSRVGSSSGSGSSGSSGILS